MTSLQSYYLSNCATFIADSYFCWIAAFCYYLLKNGFYGFYLIIRCLCFPALIFFRTDSLLWSTVEITHISRCVVFILPADRAMDIFSWHAGMFCSHYFVRCLPRLIWTWMRVKCESESCCSRPYAPEWHLFRERLYWLSFLRDAEKERKNQLLEAERCFSTFLSLLYCVDVLDNVNIIQVQLLLKFGCACSGLLSPYWSFSSKWCLFNSQSQWYPLYQKWHFLTIRFLCDRIEAKHQELRDREVQNRFCPPDVEDDDLDPNYARINTFRERGSPSQPIYGNRSPSPQRPTPPFIGLL